MSTYVISDIHSCFDDFQAMLDKIGLSDDDRLILAGDYVDRGRQSMEMLRWIETKPSNVIAVKGNHDAEFVEYIRMLQQTDRKNELMTDPASNDDARILLDTERYLFKKKAPLGLLYFDFYGTVTDLIENRGVTFGELCRWADMLDGFPYYERFDINGRDCVVVHAGFCEDADRLGDKYKSVEDFYLEARDDAIKTGGICNGMIIAGHTPTSEEDSVFYNAGKVFRYHDTAKDCIFYNIDCGCSSDEAGSPGTLACLRVDDEKIFYL